MWGFERTSGGDPCRMGSCTSRYRDTKEKSYCHDNVALFKEQESSRIKEEAGEEESENIGQA